MINCLIFSRDRACQLDLLLRSIRDNFKDINHINVLIKATNRKYRKSYDKIFDDSVDLPGYSFWYEAKEIFKEDVMQIVDGSFFLSNEHTICFCDDDVVIRPIDLEILKYFKNDVNAISLRMGKHINYCYPKNAHMELPTLVEYNGKYMMWNWQHYNRHLDWGYPMSLAGNIYRTEFLKDLWNKIPFDAPNWMEGYMALNAPKDKPYQVSYQEQHVYNVAVNLVQTVCKNRHSGKYPIEKLNQKFLDGYIISTETLYNKTFNSANGEAEYKLIKA